MDVGIAGHAGFFDMSEEELAQGGGVQAAFQVGVVEIVAGEIPELFGDVIVLVAGEGGSGRGSRIVLAMLSEEVESLDGVGEGQRSLVFEVFAGYVEHWKLFYHAIKAKYPDIKFVADGWK